MAEQRTTPEAPDGGRKRTAPTIDLTATEVQQTPPESEPVPPPAPQPEPISEPEAPQPGDTLRAAEGDTPRDDTAHQADGRHYAASFAAGIAGAIVVIAVLAVARYAGWLPVYQADTNGQSAKIAALEKQIQDLQSRPAPTPDTKAVEALRAKVNEIETAVANLPPGDRAIAERLSAADNAMKSLGVALAALTRRSDDIAANAQQAQQRADAAAQAVKDLQDSVQHATREASAAVDPAALDALGKRIAALEQSAQSMRQDVAEAVAGDKATRLALSAASLRAAVASGAPFAAELARAKSLGADEAKLAPLAAFAQSGIPGKAALARELSALLPALSKAAGEQNPPSGFFERLQANAGKLVRIRPVDAPSGDTPSDLLARIEAEAGRADIDAALADLAKLPADVRKPAEGWIAKVKARQAALSAAQRFAADTANALGKS
jgi:hypothetical protein